YWSPFSDSPSPRAYGETSNDEGKAAFDAYCNNDFPLSQEGASGSTGDEVSPFGFALGIRYPQLPAHTLVSNSQTALESWRKAGPQAWVGVALEILHRLNR